MKIPDLPPDIHFPPLTEADYGFSYAVKADAMRQHVEPRWGWDDSLQRRIHDEKMKAKPFSAIVLHGSPVGTVALERHEDHLQFGEFYLISAFRGQGLGSRILTHSLKLADELGLPVSLEYLLWNPVGSLYRRHGFVETSKTESHCLLTRPISPSASAQ